MRRKYAASRLQLAHRDWVVLLTRNLAVQACPAWASRGCVDSPLGNANALQQERHASAGTGTAMTFSGFKYLLLSDLHIIFFN